MHPPKQFDFIQTTRTAEIRLPLVMGLPLLPSVSESIAQQCEQAQETDQKAFRRGASAHGNNLTHLIFFKFLAYERFIIMAARTTVTMVAIRYVKPISPSVMVLPPQITYFIILLFFWFITRSTQDRQAIAQKVYYAIHQTAGNLCRHNPNRAAP